MPTTVDTTATDGTDTTTDDTTTVTPTTTVSTTDDTTPGTTTTTGPDTTTEPDTTTDPDTTTEPDTTTTTTGAGLSWETDVYPQVVEGNCGCHQQGSGGLTFTNAQDSYANIIGVASTQAAGFDRVTAGDPNASYFLAKVNGTSGEAPFNGNPAQMPLGGSPLDGATIELLEQWIADGALP
ncbi:hypothetical protein [Nannocystis bainbridge]|uniref:Cytochrome c domain-containing protein n=1 Tax=Nannocystis bainbridge TaxID=2995303 RepID=A0ABT5ECG5_9BACT|nr:hypothetical protein [Nannocystis bainbridge]MDC0722476.1 hypothetical protein [Nannocystis bainbridge]